MRELAILFLRLGATTFGGPAAHIAVMEEEIVRRHLPPRILLASAVALLRLRVSSSWLVLSAGLVSVLARSLG